MKNYNLVAARKSKMLTQEQLAKKLGCKKTSVSNWENGVSTPSLEVAFTVAEILEKDIGYLFNTPIVQESHTRGELMLKKVN